MGAPFLIAIIRYNQGHINEGNSVVNNMRRLFYVLFLLLFATSLASAQDDLPQPPDLSVGLVPVRTVGLITADPFDTEAAWTPWLVNGGTLALESGRYHARLEANGIAVALHAAALDNMVIEVEMTPLAGGQQTAYILLCRADGDNPATSDQFIITATGQASINNQVYGDASALLNSAQPNRITAVCVDEYLALYINGRLFLETEDTTLTTGVGGLMVFAGDARADVLFDNFRLWYAERGEAPAATPTRTPAPEATAAVASLEQLTVYDSEPETAMAELHALGLLGKEYAPAFSTQGALNIGDGNWFTPLGRTLPASHFVLSAELNFTPGDINQTERCTLAARVQTDDVGQVQQQIEVGFTNDGSLIAMETRSGDELATLERAAIGLDLTRPHHLLALVLDERLTVYVDGERILHNITVSAATGHYGVVLVGRGEDARCEARNIWAYHALPFQVGRCEAVAWQSVNRRSGAGTDFRITGALPPGQNEPVTGLAIAADGSRWVQLEDGDFVAETVVWTVGECDALPPVP